jgi:hypothetical protein
MLPLNHSDITYGMKARNKFQTRKVKRKSPLKMIRTTTKAMLNTIEAMSDRLNSDLKGAHSKGLISVNIDFINA